MTLFVIGYGAEEMSKGLGQKGYSISEKEERKKVEDYKRIIFGPGAV